MNTQIATEMELISERAARIPALAARRLGAMALRGAEEEDICNILRNVAGTLDMIIDVLSVREGRRTRLARTAPSRAYGGRKSPFLPPGPGVFRPFRGVVQVQGV